MEYLTDHDVDLIVLDMIMEPGMDGYDTYLRIRESSFAVMINVLGGK